MTAEVIRRERREKILSELEENKGTQFDPKIAEIFIELIKNGKIDMSD